MPTIRNILRGRQAKRRGNMAENILHSEAYRTGWTVVKIPMGAKMLSKNKMIRIRTDFDFVFIKGPHVLFIDSKTTKAKSYSYSQQTDHQVKILREIEKHGHQAGYIVSFSTLKKTVFFKGSQLWDLRSGASLKPEDGIFIGTDTVINLGKIFGTEDIRGVLFEGNIPDSKIG